MSAIASPAKNASPQKNPRQEDHQFHHPLAGSHDLTYKVWMRDVHNDH